MEISSQFRCSSDYVATPGQAHTGRGSGEQGGRKLQSHLLDGREGQVPGKLVRVPLLCAVGLAGGRDHSGRRGLHDAGPAPERGRPGLPHRRKRCSR